MREIDVIFLKPSGTPPVVQSLVERGAINEEVVWNIVSCDSRVKYVEIEFDRNQAKFFRDPHGPKTKHSKKLVKKLGPGRRVQIYGHAPGGSGSPVQDKYTVRGYSKNPLSPKNEGLNPIAELDPLFVTDKP